MIIGLLGMGVVGSGVFEIAEKLEIGRYDVVMALESIAPLKGMQKLGYVYMDYNKLTSVDDIADCYCLVQVNVYGNEIQDVSKLTEHDIIVNYDPTFKG